MAFLFLRTLQRKGANKVKFRNIKKTDTQTIELKQVKLQFKFFSNGSTQSIAHRSGFSPTTHFFNSTNSFVLSTDRQIFFSKECKVDAQPFTSTIQRPKEENSSYKSVWACDLMAEHTRWS